MRNRAPPPLSTVPVPQDSRLAIEAVWRKEAGRIVAVAARITRDIGVAEELLQDTLLAALEHWPREGVPHNPAAWLTAAVKRRALDHLRHRAMAEGKHAQISADLAAQDALQVPDLAEDLVRREADPIGDDLLRLILIACHPVLSRDAQVALTLRLLGGLSTGEIARAFLTAEPTIAQRIVRAKRTLGEARVPFELPPAQELGTRLGGVLEVIYLIFNEGYAATAGDDLLRPALCDEARRLAHMVTLLAPREPEALALAALLDLQASRAQARVDAAGDPVLLADQDRSRWDRRLIRQGLEALARAEKLSAGTELGPYALQAAIAACHARAARFVDTDWTAICRLYDCLMGTAPSPVVALNRAVAVSMAQGPAAALPLVRALEIEGRLASYHLLYSVHAELLARLGEREEARAKLSRAIDLARNEREKRLLRDRLQALSDR